MILRTKNIDAKLKKFNYIGHGKESVLLLMVWENLCLKKQNKTTMTEC